MLKYVVDKFESLYKSRVDVNRWNEYMQNHIFTRYSKKYFEKSYKQLEKNIKFKNMYSGRRCFILGNGPSLKEQDLSFLKDEIVFTVNQAARSNYFESIKTNFHFIADPDFFKLDVNNIEDKEVMKAICEINKGNNYPICFVPIQFENFILKNQLEKKINIAYFNPSLILCDNYDTEIDFCKFIPGSNTVVHYAIMFAIYTGCTEIILMGCECTLILRDIQEILNLPIDTYSYDVTKNESKRLSRINSSRDFVKIMESNIAIFKQYKYLYQYCKKNEITLVNATPQTLLDTVPRVRLENLMG